MPQTQDIAARVLSARDNPNEINDIIKEYMPYIASVTSKVCSRQVQYGVDDELSIAMLGFHDAVNSYVQARGAFLKYAAVVMKNRVLDYAKKERRHNNVVSIHGSDGEGGLEDTLADQGPSQEDAHARTATQDEINELAKELQTYDITFSELGAVRPKQERTVQACRKIAEWTMAHKDAVAEMKQSKRLPVAHICEYTGLERKTVERHRKYIIAIVTIYSNGYELIRGHLQQVLIVKKEGRQG